MARKPTKKEQAKYAATDKIVPIPDKKPEPKRSKRSRQVDRQRDKERVQNEQAVVDAAKKLDPKDRSTRARYLREVAEQIEDHQSSRRATKDR